MKVSCAEFLGGKEADDAYNKLCELTGVEWDVKRTCKPIQREYLNWLGRSIMGEFCECGHLLEDFVNYCSNCGAKVVVE